MPRKLDAEVKPVVVLLLLPVAEQQQAPMTQRNATTTDLGANEDRLAKSLGKPAAVCLTSIRKG